MKFLSQDKLHVNEKFYKIQAQKFPQKNNSQSTDMCNCEKQFKRLLECSCLESWIISLWYEIIHIIVF